MTLEICQFDAGDRPWIRKKDYISVSRSDQTGTP